MPPEQRERLSRLAKERHAAGKFGGSEFGKLGGYHKQQRVKDRVAKRVAEAAQNEEMALQLIQVFRDAIQPSQPTHIRIKAAEALIAIERDEARIAMAEEEHDAKKHSREELLQILSGNLTEGPISALLRKQIDAGEVIDAEAVEIRNPSRHDERLAERMEDPEFREEFERATEEIQDDAAA